MGEVMLGRRATRLVLATLVSASLGAGPATAGEDYGGSVEVRVTAGKITMLESTPNSLTPITATSFQLYLAPSVYATVYTRGYSVCVYFNLHLVSECSRGRFYFVPNVLAWGANYYTAGVRGVHDCHVPGSRTSAYIVHLQSCGEHRFSASYTKQWDEIEICVYTGAACKVVAYHVNMYWSGYISPAYGGLGA